MADTLVDPELEGEEVEEEEKPDPALKAPDLYNSAKENNTEKVLALLTEDVPPFYFDKKTQWTALHWASVNGNANMVRKLLEAGAHKKYHRQIAREERQKNGGISAEKEMSIEEQTQIQEELEADQEDIAQKINYLKSTPLLWASLKGMPFRRSLSGCFQTLPYAPMPSPPHYNEIIITRWKSS